MAKITDFHQISKWYTVQVRYNLGGTRDTYNYMVQAFDAWEAMSKLSDKLLAARSTIERMEIGEADRLAGVLV